MQGLHQVLEALELREEENQETEYLEKISPFLTKCSKSP